jgi:hypothetical protein
VTKVPLNARSAVGFGGFIEREKFGRNGRKLMGWDARCSKISLAMAAAAKAFDHPE